MTMAAAPANIAIGSGTIFKIASASTMAVIRMAKGAFWL